MIFVYFFSQKVFSRFTILMMCFFSISDEKSDKANMFAQKVRKMEEKGKIKREFLNLTASGDKLAPMGTTVTYIVSELDGNDGNTIKTRPKRYAFENEDDKDGENQDYDDESDDDDASEEMNDKAENENDDLQISVEESKDTDVDNYAGDEEVKHFRSGHTVIIKENVDKKKRKEKKGKESVARKSQSSTSKKGKQ